MQFFVKAQCLETFLVQALEIEFRFLDKFAQETVLQALSIHVIDLRDCSELYKVHHNVLNLILFTDKEHINVFSCKCSKELHQGDHNLKESCFETVASIESELNHLNRLIGLWLNLQVKGDGAHEADDICYEYGILDTFVATVFLEIFHCRKSHRQLHHADENTVHEIARYLTFSKFFGFICDRILEQLIFLAWIIHYDLLPLPWCKIHIPQECNSVEVIAERADFISLIICVLHLFQLFLLLRFLFVSTHHILIQFASNICPQLFERLSQ